MPLTSLIGMLLIIVGLLFKVAAAPFQAWAPDVYQGSPTGYVGYMASVAKVSSFIVLARLSAVSIRFVIDKFELFFDCSNSLSTVWCTFRYESNRFKKTHRLQWCYSIWFYLIWNYFRNKWNKCICVLFSYLRNSTNRFVYIFSLISGSLGSNFSVENLSGLFKNNKLITIAFSVFMLGVAGLPLTSGFVSKFILITNLWSYEKYTLVVVLMLSTVAGFYFYKASMGSLN